MIHPATRKKTNLHIGTRKQHVKYSLHFSPSSRAQFVSRSDTPHAGQLSRILASTTLSMKVWNKTLPSSACPCGDCCIAVLDRFSSVRLSNVHSCATSSIEVIPIFDIGSASRASVGSIATRKLCKSFKNEGGAGPLGARCGVLVVLSTNVGG